jgi:DNA ligase-1
MRSRGNVLKYSILAEAYEKIEGTTKRLEMTDLLVDLLKQAPKKFIDSVIYLTQGKLYPDFVGIELGIAEKLAFRALASVSGVSEVKVEESFKRTGDLGKTAELFMTKKSQSTLVQRELSVELVYDGFVKIAHAAGSGSIDVKIRFLSSLLHDASPLEARYIMRTALGRLRLGVADMTILDALAIAYGGGKDARNDLERAYNLSSDLGLVAKIVATEGVEAVKKFRVKVGRPIRPMLAERLSTSQEILEKLGGRGAAEYKYDGIRLQAHISPRESYLFSRRLENVTEQFPDALDYIRESIDASEAVVEGECVAVDPNTGDMLPFQMISQRRGRKYEIERMEEEVPVHVYLFDVLYLDGKDYTVVSYPERRQLLEQVVKKNPHAGVSDQLVTDDPNQLDAYMDQAVSDGCEGLMVKSVGSDSDYKAGARGWTWIKYKRSYKAEIADTFDLVAIGAFYGRGKRAGSYGALLTAAYDPKEDQFETICKLGSGFTDEDLSKLPEMLKPFRIAHRHARITCLMTPDVWFSPALVLEVAADEITLSPLHTCARDIVKKGAGLALRFPRFTGNWRIDKAPEDATTRDEILEIYRSQLKKIETETAPNV